MKKTLTILISFYLFFMFLVYSGIFRKNSDPLSVTKYYFQCLKDGEWFLTYSVNVRGNFSMYKIFDDYLELKLFLIKDVILNLEEFKEQYAVIQAKIIYNDNKEIYSRIILIKNNKIWLIKEVKYSKNKI